MLATAPLTGWSAAWDAAQFAQHGGTYASACQDPSALRLRIETQHVVAERGGRRIVARITDSAFSYFGRSAPPAFQTALLTDQTGGRELVFLVMRDLSGRYLQIHADARTLAELGLRPNDRSVFRDCDTARRSSDGAIERAEQAQAARDAQAAAAAHAMADPAWAAAYRRTFGPHLAQPWLARLDGPAAPPRMVRIAGQDYRLHAACKPHDCADNNMVFLYAADTGQAHALLFEGGRRQRLLGAPPPAVATALQQLWRSTWRRQP